MIETRTRLRSCVAFVLVALSASAQAPAVTHHTTPSPVIQSSRERDERMGWWREARFGLFIHWGIYSVPAGIWKGRVTTRDSAHLMQRLKLPVADYAAVAREFNPDKFNADAWVRLAKRAGMRYVVFTAKHHDGFAMFDTKASNFDIVESTPFGRDVLKEIAEACAKHDMRLGIYYSHARDWHHPGGGDFRGHWDPTQEGEMSDYIRNVAAPQVRELLTNYGPVSILWWDTPDLMTPELAALITPALELQPSLIVNNRLGGGVPGDFYTPENVVPAAGMPGDWEACMTMNGSWGFRVNDNNWKPAPVLIRTLIDTASKGGNFLLNVGPNAAGEIPKPSVERLDALGAWMLRYSESIHGTTGVPFKRLSWGRATRKDDRLYVHVFDWPQDGELIVPMREQPRQAFMLGEPGRTFSFAGTEAGLRIQLTGPASDTTASVIVLDGIGEVTPLRPPPIEANADGSVTLACDTAELQGPHLRVAGGVHLNLAGWDSADAFAEWDVQFPSAGNFEVAAELNVPADQAGSGFVLSAGGSTLNGTLAAAGDAYKTEVLGQIEIKSPGRLTVRLEPSRLARTEFMRLRKLELKPVD